MYTIMAVIVDRIKSTAGILVEKLLGTNSDTLKQYCDLFQISIGT